MLQLVIVGMFKMLMGVIRKAVSFVAILGVAGAIVLPANGQVDFPGDGGSSNVMPPSPGDIQTLYNSAGLDVLDASVFGDNVDIDTGALSFRHTDISLPGNSDLPVAITRELSRNADIGSGWMFVIPHIRQKYLDTKGVPLPEAPSGYYGPQADRCATDAVGGYNNFLRIVITGGFEPIDESVVLQKHEFYDGLTLVDTSGASRNLLLNGSERTLPGPTAPSPEFTASGSQPKFVSKDNWIVNCLPSTKNNQGEGFIATSPNGWRYKFDYRVAYKMPMTTWPHPQEPVYQERLYVSEISDPHGNWVRYSYNGSALRRITANDGRRIDISGNRITASGRTWTYEQRTNSGLKVTLPDGTFWEMGVVASSGDVAPFQTAGPNNEVCAHFDWQDYRVRHPSGSTATFRFDVIRNGKYKLSDPIENLDYGPHITGLPNIGSCGPADPVLSHPSSFVSLAVTEKIVTVPQDGTHTWTWEYSDQDFGSYETYDAGLGNLVAAGPIKTRKTTKPDGSYMITYINRQYGLSEGQIEKVETYDTNDRLMQTEVFDYEYGNRVGVGFGQNSRQFAKATRYRVYQTSRILTLDGESYTTAREFQTDPSARDFAYGAPRKVTQSSTLQTPKRITETTYEHKKDKWILGLPKTVTRNGKLFTENTYNGLGQLTRADQFGVRQASLTYYSDGTLRTFKDALNRTTTLRDYKRGTPQRFDLPENTRITQTVDNNGWITSQTNARGHTTTLTYDAGGRVTRVNRPGNLANIDITYSGLGSGNLTRTVTTGSQRTITKHDGFLRPYQTRQQALSGGGGNIYTRTEYDGLGRVIFQSFPRRSLSPTTTGVETTYDGLGRAIETRENVAPYATTRTIYTTRNRMRVIDPEGNTTFTRRSGYGSPDDGNPIWVISYPDGYPNNATRIVTSMTYDIYGNLTRAVRNGINQRWRYDNRLRVCNAFTPETGGRRYAYDDAGQVIAYSEGHTSGSCGTPSSSGRITNTYDDLGRLIRVNYPAGTPDTTMTYDANGNVLTNQRGGANWTYTYDANDQLTDEVLTIDGRTFASKYIYNANGHVTGRRTPYGRMVYFEPDGFGRATNARVGSNSYATGVSYHPNGQLKSATYRNGFVYSATQNIRQQTLRARSARGATVATDFQYAYDANGRITTINDRARPADSRAYAYDGAGRLVSASGEWGNASYQYDALNNLLSKEIGSRTVSLSYDSRNRLASANDSAVTGTQRTYTHDSRGNVIGDGRFVYIYDRANQPTAMSGGGTTGSFVYDGNYKRVKQVINGETIYSVYSLSGELLFRENITTGEQICYITLGLGGKTLVRMLNASPNYIHSDHLGTPVAATRSTGTIRWTERFTPFGESTGTPSLNFNQRGFTGHMRDRATGLTYMQARYYDPVVGRFLSNDPVGFAQGGVDYFNRYSYTANDPINAIDPDGRDIERIISDEGDDVAEAARRAANEVSESGTDTAELQRTIRDSVYGADNAVRLAGGGDRAASRGVQRNSLLGRLFGGKKFRHTGREAGVSNCCNSALKRPGAGQGNLNGSSILVGTVSAQERIHNGFANQEQVMNSTTAFINEQVQDFANVKGAPFVVVFRDLSPSGKIPPKQVFLVTPD